MENQLSRSSPASGRGRILVVEDEIHVRRLCARHLTDAGFMTTEASCPSEALDLLASDVFDLILTDVVMPGMSGLEMLAQMRRERSGLRSIVMSGFLHDDPANVIRLSEVGAYTFLSKPFSRNALVSTVERAFAASENETEIGLLPTESTTAPAETPSETPSINVEAPAASIMPPIQPKQTEPAAFPFLIGGLLHDAFNTLWALKSQIGSLMKFGVEIHPGASQRTHVESMALQVQHLEQVMRLMQVIAQSYYKAADIAAMPPCQQLADHLSLLRESHSGIEIGLSIAEEFNEVQLPVGLMEFIAGELMTNAARACANDEFGVVYVSVNVVSEGAARSSLSVQCADTGPGFSKDLLDRLIAGEIRRPAHLGSGGYGIYLIKEVVQRLHGSILFSNNESGGARVQVLLPLKGEAK